MNVKKGPWTVKGTKIVYENQWIKVREDQVIRPDGKDGTHAVVEMIPGATILPLDNEENVYLTKEFHYAVSSASLEAVSGGVHGKENILETAKRELKEEVGITAKEWIDLGVEDPFTTVVISPNYLFLARNLTFGKTKREGTEQIKVVKMSLKEAVKQVMESKITHSATCILILKANLYLEA